MPTWKEIKRKLKSVQSIGKITKAMELISIVKMKKAQELALEKKQYIHSLFEVLMQVGDYLLHSKFFQPQASSTKTLCVIITSNKGLCGSYNVNILKKISHYLKEHQNETVEFVILWKKWSVILAKSGHSLLADFSSDFSDILDYPFSKTVSRFLQEKFLTPEYGKVCIFYNHFVNTMKQVPIAKQWLPLTKVSIEMYFQQLFWMEWYEEKKKMQKESEYKHCIIEPSKTALVDQVLPWILDSMFYDILIEAKASEHSARMIAMKNAKENAFEYKEKLTLLYNKARQAYITKEVSEIVSGVEAMKDV